MATFSDPYGIGTGIGEYYGGALANDPRLPAINRNISGQIAPDVRNQIAQAAAERGVGVGSYGGGNDQSSLLRALGLTSMDLTTKGLGQYGDAYNSVPKLDPTSLFVNPTTIFNDTASLRDLQLKLAADKAQQTAQIAAQERVQANSLAASGSQFARSLGASQSAFGQQREDALSGMAKTDAALQGIIDRNSGGGKYGFGGFSGNTGWQQGTAKMGAAANEASITGGQTPFSWANYASQPTIPRVDPVYYGEYSDPYAGGFVDETYPAWEDQLVDW